MASIEDAVLVKKAGEAGFRVWLNVKNQHFPIGVEFSVENEALWYKDQLKLALKKLFRSLTEKGDEAHEG